MVVWLVKFFNFKKLLNILIFFRKLFFIFFYFYLIGSVILVVLIWFDPNTILSINFVRMPSNKEIYDSLIGFKLIFSIILLVFIFFILLFKKIKGKMTLNNLLILFALALKSIFLGLIFFIISNLFFLLFKILIIINKINKNYNFIDDKVILDLNWVQIIKQNQWFKANLYKDIINTDQLSEIILFNGGSVSDGNLSQPFNQLFVDYFVLANNFISANPKAIALTGYLTILFGLHLYTTLYTDIDIVTFTSYLIDMGNRYLTSLGKNIVKLFFPVFPQAGSIDLINPAWRMSLKHSLDVNLFIGWDKNHGHDNLTYKYVINALRAGPNWLPTDCEAKIPLPALIEGDDINNSLKLDNYQPCKSFFGHSDAWFIKKSYFLNHSGDVYLSTPIKEAVREGSIQCWEQKMIGSISFGKSNLHEFDSYDAYNETNRFIANEIEIPPYEPIYDSSWSFEEEVLLKLVPSGIKSTDVNNLHPYFATILNCKTLQILEPEPIRIISNTGGILTKLSPYANQDIPVSRNFYSFLDTSALIGEFQHGGFQNFIYWSNFYFLASLLGSAGLLTNRILRLSDIVSGKEYTCPYISTTQDFLHPQQRIATALFEAKSSSRVLPSNKGYYHSLPINPTADLKQSGVYKFVETNLNYIKLCLRKLDNTSLIELREAYSIKNWDKFKSMKPSEINVFMLKNKSVGSFLVQSRNDFRLIPTINGSVDGEFEWYKQPHNQCRFKPTDDQIRNYLDIELIFIQNELNRRKFCGSTNLDLTDIVHYQHELLRENRFPVINKTWLGPENIMINPNGPGFIEVYRPAPFFQAIPIQAFDFANQNAVIAQMVWMSRINRGQTLFPIEPGPLEQKALSVESFYKKKIFYGENVDPEDYAFYNPPDWLDPDTLAYGIEWW